MPPLTFRPITINQPNVAGLLQQANKGFNKAIEAGQGIFDNYDKGLTERDDREANRRLAKLGTEEDFRKFIDGGGLADLQHISPDTQKALLDRRGGVLGYEKDRSSLANDVSTRASQASTRASQASTRASQAVSRAISQAKEKRDIETHGLDIRTSEQELAEALYDFNFKKAGHTEDAGRTNALTSEDVLTGKVNSVEAITRASQGSEATTVADLIADQDAIIAQNTVLQDQKNNDAVSRAIAGDADLGKVVLGETANLDPATLQSVIKEQTSQEDAELDLEGRKEAVSFNNLIAEVMKHDPASVEGKAARVTLTQALAETTSIPGKDTVDLVSSLDEAGQQRVDDAINTEDSLIDLARKAQEDEKSASDRVISTNFAEELLAFMDAHKAGDTSTVEAIKAAIAPEDFRYGGDEAAFGNPFSIITNQNTPVVAADPVEADPANASLAFIDRALNSPDDLDQGSSITSPQQTLAELLSTGLEESADPRPNFGSYLDRLNLSQVSTGPDNYSTSSGDTPRALPQVGQVTSPVKAALNRVINDVPDLANPLLRPVVEGYLNGNTELGTMLEELKKASELVNDPVSTGRRTGKVKTARQKQIDSNVALATREAVDNAQNDSIAKVQAEVRKVMEDSGQYTEAEIAAAMPEVADIMEKSQDLQKKLNPEVSLDANFQGLYEERIASMDTALESTPLGYITNLAKSEAFKEDPTQALIDTVGLSHDPAKDPEAPSGVPAWHALWGTGETFSRGRVFNTIKEYHQKYNESPATIAAAMATIFRPDPPFRNLFRNRFDEDVLAEVLDSYFNQENKTKFAGEQTKVNNATSQVNKLHKEHVRLETVRHKAEKKGNTATVNRINTRLKAIEAQIIEITEPVIEQYRNRDKTAEELFKEGLPTGTE